MVPFFVALEAGGVMKNHWKKIAGSLIAVGLGAYLIASGNLAAGINTIMKAAQILAEDETSELVDAAEPKAPAENQIKWHWLGEEESK